MSKIDKVVLRETAYIAAWTGIFSALLQSVFLIVMKWDVFVLLGNLYGAALAVLNFFVMGLSIQKALTKDPKDVKAFIKTSGSVRLLILFVLTVVGVLLPLNTVAVVIPLLFPRVAIMLRPFFGKRMDAAYDVPTVSVGDETELDTSSESVDDGAVISEDSTSSDDNINENVSEGGAENE